MALNTEIWAQTLVENLFANNSFAARSVNHSAFVDNKTVHVPNAGAKPTITKNGTTFPGTPAKRTDNDLNYDIDVFRSEPILIQNAEEVELSYDKRSSVLMNSREALTEAIHSALLSSWVASNGKSVTAATFSKDTISAIALEFNKKDIPQDGRCIILTPDAYSELFEELSDAEQFAFSQSANAATGVIGKYAGFDVYMRSVIDTAASNKTSALAWHVNSVSRALGSIKIFENEDDATYYGSIMSAEVRAGGKGIRYDKAGIVKVVTA